MGPRRYIHWSYHISPLRRFQQNPISLPIPTGRVIPRLRTSTRTMAPRHSHGNDSTILPPLPAIHSQGIRQQIFTHRSFHGRPTHVFEDHLNDLSPDNERFEHLGDTVLGLIVTTLMLEMYPGLHVGPLTKIRALIVGNTTLAEISRKYRLHDCLLLHPSQATTLRASVNIQADVFESYMRHPGTSCPGLRQAFIGGLYKEQGIEAVRTWLVPLFRQYAAEAYRLVRKQYGLPPAMLPTPTSSPPPSSPSSTHSGESLMLSTDISQPSSAMSPLAVFNQHITKINRHVEWAYSDGSLEGLANASTVGTLEDRTQKERDRKNVSVTSASNGTRRSALEVLMAKGNKSTPVWIARVFVEGELFGAGRGNTKKIARNEAAKQGLEKLGVTLDR
ncbi:hypothetical protein AX15_000703 [Amanita polypyramis BW_CC]|nr:hypothetical protein AX15_000703 [Amanita polypyramis BW_CC]